MSEQCCGAARQFSTAKSDQTGRSNFDYFHIMRLEFRLGPTHCVHAHTVLFETHTHTHTLTQLLDTEFEPQIKCFSNFLFLLIPVSY